MKAYFWLFLFVLFGLVVSFFQPVFFALSTIAALLGKGKVKQWGINCWEGADNQVSAQLGGDPDESISSRLGKAREKGSGWGYIADKVDLVALDIFNDANHCQKSMEHDRGSKQVTNY